MYFLFPFFHFCSEFEFISVEPQDQIMTREILVTMSQTQEPED